jgi:hypothetical protein
MKNLNVLVGLLLSVCLFDNPTFANTLPLPHYFKCFNRTVNLQEGEPIYLELVSDTKVDDLEIGNALQFRVNTNVIIDGKEVVRAFTVATGSVSKIEKSGYNTYPKIQINIRHVRAVDGQQILVDGPNNLNDLTIGTQLTVYVKSALKIEVK